MIPQEGGEIFAKFERGCDLLLKVLETCISFDGGPPSAYQLLKGALVDPQPIHMNLFLSRLASEGEVKGEDIWPFIQILQNWEKDENGGPKMRICLQNLDRTDFIKLTLYYKFFKSLVAPQK